MANEKLEPLQTYEPGHGGMYTITSGVGTYIKLDAAQAREKMLTNALRVFVDSLSSADHHPHRMRVSPEELKSARNSAMAILAQIDAEKEEHHENG